ncbi:MAG TPA: hypothetical protein VH561_02870 [Micromonosporaceae bacterium]
MELTVDVVTGQPPANDSPFTEADIVGLYPPEAARVAALATACDQGSGPTRIDD